MQDAASNQENPPDQQSLSDVSSNAPSFDLFWQDSTYSQFNVKEFAAAQEQFAARDKVTAIVEYPSKPLKLTLPRTAANSLARRRKSGRTFTGGQLSKREFSTLLSSFYAHNGPEHRAFPSAGGAYVVEVFAVANNVADYTGKIVYYNPDLHAVSVVGDAPEWAELAPNVNLQTSDTPQCLLLFVLFPERLTAKYLERGGRFALIEVGLAAQQLALQIAGSRKLKGVAVGGLLDDYWLRLLGLNRQEAKIALGYACGK